jgi:DNA-binding LacI/PurR family transcriptional regulator
MPPVGTKKLTTPRSEHSPRVRAATELRRWLDEGRFAAGEILPTEEMLCQSLRVSRGTVRAALSQLESEGLVQGQKGPGRLRGRIAHPSGTAGTSLLRDAIVLCTSTANPAANAKGGNLTVMDSGALARIQEGGMHVFLLHEDALTMPDVTRLRADIPAGVVVGPVIADYTHGREMLAQLGSIPVVVASDEPLWSQCDRVISDHEAGAFALTSWLLKQGRRKILRVWPEQKETPYWLAARNIGIEKAMVEAGITPLPPVIIPPLHPITAAGTEEERGAFHADVRAAAGHLVEYLSGSKPKVDAIMAVSDSASFIVAAACRLFGWQPNKDVWIVGYDNFWEEDAARKFEPSNPVATVDKQNHLLGEVMVDLLRDRIGGRLPPEPQRRVLPPELIIVPQA